MTQTYLLTTPAAELHRCRCVAAYAARLKGLHGLNVAPDASAKREAAEAHLRTRITKHPGLIAPAIAELEEEIVQYTAWAAEAWGRSQKSALGSSPQGRRNAKIEAAEHRERRDMHMATLAVVREFAA